MWRTRYAAEVKTEDHATVQRLAGWIEESRNLGKIAFLVVRDRTGAFQVVLPKGKVPDEMFERLTKLNRESVVAVEGKVAPTKSTTFTWEVKPDRFWVLNEAQAPLPLGVVDKVNIDIDTRLDARFMDLRRPGPQAIFKIRNTVLAAGHEYLRGRGFVEIHTSKIIGSSSEGGTEVFRVKYFERDAYLSQSPQLYKQAMMATGLDRVYEVATYFRAEKHNTPRHLNEITAFDLEMAYIESEEEVMEAIEGLMANIWNRVASEHPKELETVAKEYHPQGIDPVKSPKVPFARLTFAEAVKRLQDAGHQPPARAGFEDEAKRGEAWAHELGGAEEKALARLLEPEGHRFFFITKYPLVEKPFYCMPENGSMQDTWCRAFDLEYRGVELLSGAQRIHQPDLLVEGLRRKDLDPKDFEGYLKAFRYGMPPHGGCGIGIERILMQMLDLPNIREAVLFPRDRVRLSP
jgi:aspartyl-tRNA synthetase